MIARPSSSWRAFRYSRRAPRSCSANIRSRNSSFAKSGRRWRSSGEVVTRRQRGREALGARSHLCRLDAHQGGGAAIAAAPHRAADREGRASRDERPSARRGDGRLLGESLHGLRGQGAGALLPRPIRAREHPPARAREIPRSAGRRREESRDALLPRQLGEHGRGGPPRTRGAPSNGRRAEPRRFGAPRANATARRRRGRAASTRTTDASCSSSTRSAWTAATRRPMS